MSEDTKCIAMFCVTIVLVVLIMASCEYHADSVGDPHGAVAHGLK